MTPESMALAVRLAWLGAGWVGYFVLHSALASLVLKRAVARRFPAWMPAYRLAFNALAVLLALPLLWWTLTAGGPVMWRWTGAWSWAADILAAAAAAGFVTTLRDYDGGEFLGTRQWHARQTRVEDQERFRLSPLHRHVRHPWYALGLVILWTRDMDAARLLAAVLATGYVVVGMYLEERKLVALHGDAYREYRRRVPPLVPLPWRRLGGDEAAKLERQAEAARGAGGERHPGRAAGVSPDQRDGRPPDP
jgi:protein-S-isoprenylcysteine O-methyltransferase Ste14